MSGVQYEVLFPRVMIQVQPCPRMVALDAMQTVASDFFTRSGIWCDVLVAQAYKGERFVEIPVERGTAIVRVTELLVDGEAQEGGVDFRVAPAGEGMTIELTFVPDQERTVYARTVLRPSRTALTIPKVFVDEWGDALCYGTLAKLKSMSGQHMGWTDPQGAALNLHLYEESVARAKIQVVRGREGRTLYFKAR